MYCFPEKRWFYPIRTDDLRQVCLSFIGKEVTVRSWHENIAMKEKYPNDKWVGFIEEFCCDIPESELSFIRAVELERDHG